MKVALVFAIVSLLVSGCASQKTSVQYLSKDVIRTVIAQNLLSIRKCYTNYLEGNKENYQQGIAYLTFTIGREGEVIRAKVTDDLFNSEELNSCLRNVAMSMTFAKPIDGRTVDVTQPMNLIPIKMNP